MAGELLLSEVLGCSNPLQGPERLPSKEAEAADECVGPRHSVTLGLLVSPPALLKDAELENPAQCEELPGWPTTDNGGEVGGTLKSSSSDKQG